MRKCISVFINKCSECPLCIEDIEKELGFCKYYKKTICELNKIADFCEHDEIRILRMDKLEGYHFIEKMGT